MRARFQSQKGTVLLVALCFVTVLGISLAGYIAVCSRTMQLSNRTAQTGLSQQLAEIGLEEALRAFNKNDWTNWTTNPTNVTSGAWSFDSTYNRATRTIIFNNGKLGQGVTGSVKIRVDNYNGAQLDSIWSSGTNYRANDLVGDNGVWYRCIKQHTSGSSNRPVNWNYWIPEGVPWSWNSTTTYSQDSLIVSGEIWYRSKSINTNKIPAANAGDWQPLTAVYTTAPAWPYVPSAGQEALLINSGAFTRLTYQNSTWGYNYTWRWQSVPYSFNDVVYDSGIWYRCLASHTNNGSWTYNVTNTGAGYWRQIQNIWSWDSVAYYNLNDTVYHSGTSRWYRCIKANSGQAPSTTSVYWSSAPLRSTAWNSEKAYGATDTVSYNGIWYRSLSGVNNLGQNPSVPSSIYWSSASNSPWDASTPYYANSSYVSYGGIWYQCRANNTGMTPNNTAYWTALSAPVIYAEGMVNISGSPSVKTQLRAPIAPAPLYPNAISATSNLTVSSGTGIVDSYDNSLGTNYTAQRDTSTNYSAVLASGSSLAINGTTAVRGYLAWPSPPSGISSGSTVYGPSSPASPKIDPTRVSRSPFIPEFDIHSVSDSTNLSLGNSSYTLGTPGATTPTVYSIESSSNAPNLVLNSASEILTIVGPVVIYISGNLQVSSGKIIVTSTGSAEIHFSGRLRIQNNASGGIQNLTSDPKKLILLGTSTATNHVFQSTSFDLYGTVYMPDASLTIDTGVEIYGALSAKSISFSNEAKLHFDTSLRHASISGVDQPYAITEWRELPDSERAVLP